MIPAKEAIAQHASTFAPFPWRTFYEFGRQIWVGCAVTFGPRPPHHHKPTIEPQSDASKLR
jgi:hypothetical protein